MERRFNLPVLLVSVLFLSSLVLATTRSGIDNSDLSPKSTIQEIDAVFRAQAVRVAPSYQPVPLSPEFFRSYSPPRYQIPTESVVSRMQVNRRQIIQRSGVLPCPTTGKSFQSLAPLQLERTLSADDSVTIMGQLDNLLLDTPGVVTVNSDITTNTKWDPNNIYHVTANVNVKAMLVIEPGTLVEFSSNGSLTFNDGGLLIACGTPSDLIWFVWDSGVGYGEYYCPIYIQATASSACKISFCGIESAFIGIRTENIRLESAIQNNIINGCVLGIYENGPDLTDICNNAVCGTAWDAITVDFVSTGGAENPNSSVIIHNNTCDTSLDQYGRGIVLYGAYASQNRGKAQVFNNIMTNFNYYGFDWSGYLSLYLANNGYYGNGQNRSFSFEEPGAVEMDSTADSPYEPVDANDPLGIVYLKPDCPFIDAGCGGIEIIDATSFSVKFGDIVQFPFLVGSTTAKSKDSDCAFVDLGFHYSNFDKANAGISTLSADFNNDGTVNFSDYLILSQHFGQTPATRSEGDANGDGIVNFSDYLVLSQEYGQTGYVNPGIEPLLDCSPSSLSDMIGLGVAGYSNDTGIVLFFVDGDFVGSLKGFKNSERLGLDTIRYRNGSHKLKVVGVSTDGYITLSDNMDIATINSLQCLRAEDCYSPGRDYHIHAIYSGSAGIVVEIKDVDGNVRWSCSQDGESLDVLVPPSALTDQIHQVSIREAPRASMQNGFFLTAEDYKEWVSILSKEFKKENVTSPVMALITLDDPDQTKASWNSVSAAISTLRRYPNYIVLYNGFGDKPKNCSWENFSYLIRNADALGIRYWYHASHANNKDEGATFFRTMIEIGGENIYSYVKKDFGSQVPSWFQEDPNPRGLDNPNTPTRTILSLTSGYLSRGYSPFRIVFNDSCYSASFCVVYNSIPYGSNPIPHDMAYALGIYNDMFQVYFGWWDKRTDPYYPSLGGLDANFVEDFWTGLGRMKPVGQAWYEAGTGNIGMPLERTTLISSGDPWTVFLWEY